jgi:hypothetical protein
MASSPEWLDCRIKELLDWSSYWLIDCVLSVANVITRVSLRTHKFSTAKKALPPLRISVYRNPWLTSAETRGSAEPSLRNTELYNIKHCSVFLSVLDKPSTACLNIHTWYKQRRMENRSPNTTLSKATISWLLLIDKIVFGLRFSNLLFFYRSCNRASLDVYFI